MGKLSVVLATYNEEKNLGGCLESVRGLADEIIVVDGTSSDRTVEIAKSFGAKVVVTDNPQVFHINKQKAIDMAVHPWILQLDADERVTPELAEEIKEVINQGGLRTPHPSPLPQGERGNGVGRRNNEVNGYWIPRKNWFLGRFLMKGGQYPDYTLRLYRRGKGRLPQKDVHEQAVVDGEVGYLTQPLEHMSDPEFGRYLLRWGRYTDLLATQLKDQKIGYNPITVVNYLLVKPSWWFVWTYGRHKGFMDGWHGFVFSFFSALRFPVGYLKYVKIKNID